MLDLAKKLLEIGFSNRVNNFIKVMSTYYSDEYKKLSDELAEFEKEYESALKLNNGYVFFTESIKSEFYSLDEEKKLMYELAILALYKKIEITSKQFIRDYLVDNTELKTMPKIQSHLLKSYGVDIQTLQNYAAMNEIRLINNAIKHDGCINPQLANNEWNTKNSIANYWAGKKGQELTLQDLEQRYTQLAPLCIDYMAQLQITILNLPITNN